MNSIRSDYHFMQHILINQTCLKVTLLSLSHKNTKYWKFLKIDIQPQSVDQGFVKLWTFKDKKIPTNLNHRLRLRLAGKKSNNFLKFI
ncbi:hypothetical protein BpHYR1_034693 [Brachionus plicatilis]|uniref:Uncharacterized protein n=1 Tax=Brachionus plicatilis TaxID=10195 RepID=A0A3M7SH38_BRAPC|nr:hypothetical protein BpHYR1_034693 [Brachionus plicatilis]